MFDPAAALAAVEGAFGVAAVYAPPSPPGGPTVAVTILASRGDADLQIGAGMRAIASHGVFEVRKSVLAAPARGGTLTIGAAVWRIAAEPEALDPDRLVWTLRCEPSS